MKEKYLFYVVFAGVFVVLFYFWRRGAGGFAQDVVTGAGNVVKGGVVGVGSFFGIPATNSEQCEIDLAAGNNWKASFSCSAGDFVSGVFSSKNKVKPQATNSTPAGTTGDIFAQNTIVY